MKTKVLSVLLAFGGSFFVQPSTAQAAGCSPEVLRQVQNLERLTGRLESEYRAELRSGHGGRGCDSERALMESICSLNRMASILTSNVQRNGNPWDQQRHLNAMVPMYRRMSTLGHQARVCHSVRNRMEEVGQAMVRLGNTGFASSSATRYEAPRHQHNHSHGQNYSHGRDDHRHQAESARRPDPRDIIRNGLLGLLSGR